MRHWKKFIFATDVHGDEQDPGAIQVFHQFCDAWDPRRQALRVMGGDLFDFRAIRRGASVEEQAESMQYDVDAGMMFLERFRPRVFLRGNHDERLWDLAETATGVKQDYAIRGCEDIERKLRGIRCSMLPYHKREGVYRVGHLKMLHGFHSGIYSARQHGLVYGACLFGHIHCIQEHAIPGLERRVARSVGCLCKLDMPYNARHVNTLRQAHGFAYGLINERTGDYKVWQAEQTGSEWLLPTDTMAIGLP